MWALFRTNFQKVWNFLYRHYIRLRTGRYPQPEDAHPIELPVPKIPVSIPSTPKLRPFGSEEIVRALERLRTMPLYFPRSLQVDSVSRLAYLRYGENQGQKEHFQEQCNDLVAQIEDACEAEDIQLARELRAAIRLLKYQVLDDRIQRKINAAIGVVTALEQDLEYDR